MTLDRFIELFKLGLKPIPLVWDVETKSATSHCIEHGRVTVENYTAETFSTFIEDISKANGMALKLFPPFGCIDFDLKNTDDKTVFDVWMKAVSSQNDDIFSKICIERTRNSGYHVYIKYPKLSSKVTIARTEAGGEVIAIYTGGPLSYCDPTPGYSMFHNELIDLQDLTDDEYDTLISCALSFDKYVQAEQSSVNLITEYPAEYESLCLQFDKNITDEAFELLLNEIGLFRCRDYRYNKKDKFVAFLRNGSKAKYSAKVYFNTKNLQIFSSSIPGFPSFNDRKTKDDTAWNLSASRIIYYKHDKDWISTIEQIKLIAESANIELIHQDPITEHGIIKEDRLKFPFDVLPDGIINFINYQTIQHEYLAVAALSVASSLIGNAAVLKANSGYFIKPILYLAIVAPPGASKTPALKMMFEVLEHIDSKFYKEYKEEKKDYRAKLSDYKNQQKGSNIKEPTAPIMKQILIKDSTIEMVVKILSYNDRGCCILADELSGFLNRMGRYGDNDEIQKWLELWSGSPVLVQRIGREEDKVENPFCSIIGGIQPGVLETLAAKENQHNGFYHRFLFCYPEPDKKKDWGSGLMPIELKRDLLFCFDEVAKFRDYNRFFYLSKEADDLYAEWFNNKNQKYNNAINDNIKGIIAKYQDYCLRFALIIQILNHSNTDETFINVTSMERAIRLTEYFLGNMNKSLKVLAPVTPVDKLSGPVLDLYKGLPPIFSAQTAVQLATNFNIKENYCRALLRRWSDKKDQILTKSGEQKNATYEKIY